MAVFILLFILFLIYFLFHYLLGRPHPKFPPGPLRWPIWGGYLQLLLQDYKTPYKAMHLLARRYQTEILGLYLGPFSTVVACSHASVRELLSRPEFQGRIQSFTVMARDPDFMTRGVVFADQDMWTEQRRFVLRTLRDFGFGTRNKQFEAVIEEEIRDFIDLLQTDVKGVCHNGEVEVPSIFVPVFLNCSLELFLNTRLPRALHSKLKEFASESLLFQASIDGTSGALNMTPWLRHLAPNLTHYNDYTRSNHNIKKFIEEMVKEHKETFITDALRDFCDVYLKEIRDRGGKDLHHWFSEEQLVTILIETIVPSTTTVSAVLGFSVQLMIHHPEIQQKVYTEIEQMVGKSRLPTLDDRKNLPYTEAVIREVMRWQTLLPLGLPHLCTEDTYFRGHFIPKNTAMLANLWSCHMDDTVWDKPLEFLPERHLEDDGTLKKNDLTIPFGLGKRVCIAETFARQNMFLLFSSMLQHFSLELPQGHCLPNMQDFMTGFSISPKPFAVKMIPR